MSKKTYESIKSTLDDIKAKLVSMDTKLDSILTSTAPTSISNAYKDLPWKNFKEGEEGAWIYADQKGAEQLVNRLKNANGNIIFSGGYRYSLSRDGRFVRRHPIKSKEEGVSK
jgi:hypothetical protein